MNLLIKHEDKESPLAEIDLERILTFIPDKERVGLVKVICENIVTEGIIGEIRDLVNSPGLND